MGNFIEQSAEDIMLNSMANVFMPEALDPVGKEDDDIDNDGDVDKSDKYLHKRRKAVGKAIAADKAKRMKKEEIELHLRTKIGELSEKKLYKSEKATNSDEKEVTIEEKPVKNTVTINPDVQESNKLDEIAPLAVGAAAAGLAAAPYLAKKFLKPKADKALQRGRNELHLKGNPIGAGARGLGDSYEPEGESIEEKDEYEPTIEEKLHMVLERTRYAKEKGKDFKTGKDSKKGGTRVMSSRGKAIQPQGKKKKKGKKGYEGTTPVDKIKNRLAQKRRKQPDPYRARAGESD
jgi:hypothetical protein